MKFRPNYGSDNKVFWSFTVGYLVVISILLTLIIGWVSNIVKLIGMPIEQTGLFIVRVAGIFIPPLGSVLGYL